MVDVLASALPAEVSNRLGPGVKRCAQRGLQPPGEAEAVVDLGEPAPAVQANRQFIDPIRKEKQRVA
jgi:hypothetical protein